MKIGDYISPNPAAYLPGGLIDTMEITFYIQPGTPCAVAQTANIIQAIHSLEHPATIKITTGITRSLAQNAYYWASIIPAFSNHTGLSPQDAHEVLKYKLLPPRIIPDPATGEALTVLADSRSLTTAQFTAYLEAARGWLTTELGITTLDL